MTKKRKVNVPVRLRDMEQDAVTGANFRFAPEIQERVLADLEAARATEATQKEEFAKRNSDARAKRMAEMDAERAAKKKADDERLAKFAAEREASLKAEYRQRFIVAGGQPNEFEGLWTTSLREQALVQSVLTQANAAPKPRVSNDM